MSFKRIISALIFGLYIAAVAYLCFAKPSDLPQMPNNWFGLPTDKVGHFLMFLPFPILGYITFYTEKMSIWKRLALVVILLIIGMGGALATEKIQALIQYRSAEVKDLIADGAGTLCGGILTMIYILIRKKK